MSTLTEEKINVTLPDGRVLEVPRGTTARQVAESIGARLAAAALAAKANGQIVDANRPLEQDVSLEIITEKSPDALGVLRHSAAHVLATAVRRVRPDAGIGFGPAIEDGFYYDFDVKQPFTPEELEKIEQQMAEVSKLNDPFVRQVVSKEEARKLFADDPLKLERLQELGPDEVITVYRNGAFLDLCRGPHVPATGAARG
jgi:threonyl-tRNA synthetase